MEKSNDVRHPVEWIELELDDLKETPELRWTECPHYEDCLDIAAPDSEERDWGGWTCLYCPFQAKERKESTYEHNREDTPDFSGVRE